MTLQHLVSRATRQWPDALAVHGPDQELTYRELDALATGFAYVLQEYGVQRGDRIGIWLEKSAQAVVAMQAILRLGAVYVPLDPLSPVMRIQTIVHHCDIHICVTNQLRASQTLTDAAFVCLCVDHNSVWDKVVTYATRTPIVIASMEDDLAYILYTSGSTGIPKGVCISHKNALSFVHWAVETLQLTGTDRLANHAPFHFDLSVFDLYGAFSVGAAALLLPENISYLPARLINFIQEKHPTIWYSVPSVLVLMLEQGALLQMERCSLRAILFAGEPFPTKHLRRFYEHWPHVRFLNLYGPTETNVCTYYEITTLPQDQSRSVPIGRACSGDQVWAQKEDGSLVQPGEEGELMVFGPTVMLGYWGQPLLSARLYATGDLVRLGTDGNYDFLGRRDHMVKVRGYRIEIGDIEAVLLAHPAIREVAVIVQGEGVEARIIAFLSCLAQNSPSLLEVKRHCAERLPRYMIVDQIQIVDALPRTPNGKTDRLHLKTLTQKVEERKHKYAKS